MIDNHKPNDRVVAACNKRYAEAMDTLKALNKALRSTKSIYDSIYISNGSPRHADKDNIRLKDRAARLMAHLDDDILAAQEIYNITDIQRNRILQEEEL